MTRSHRVRLLALAAAGLGGSPAAPGPARAVSRVPLGEPEEHTEAALAVCSGCYTATRVSDSESAIARDSDSNTVLLMAPAATAVSDQAATAFRIGLSHPAPRGNLQHPLQ